MIISWPSSLPLVSLAVAFCAATIIPQEDGNPGALPTCDKCISKEDILTPGIGFDIADSYGTAAIRYHNGSVENLARVDGDEDFQALMRKLAAGPPALDCSSGDLSRWQKFLCWKSHLQRNRNKSRGLPATPDVGTLAALFDALRLAVDDKLGQGSCTTRVLFTLFPWLPGLTSEDFLDAVDYTGLELIASPYGPDSVSEVSAASGAMDYGVCRNYTDVYGCLDEELYTLPYRQRLFLSFTNASLTAINTYFRSAFVPNPTSRQVRFDLGRASCPEDADADADAQRIYWRQIRDTIVKVGLEGIELPSALLLVGEHAADAMFQRTLDEALRDMFPTHRGDVDGLRWSLEKRGREQNSREASSLDYAFLAARGAAGFAKRALEAPRFCWEPPECDANRARPSSTSFSGGYGEQVVLRGGL
ncbi:hypothetical protein EMPG_12955 [Blastomyces silverae]|uniref:Chitinase n=1 Tax=Blastomyces silverae TaxID=2060906 RepID=A0A0H1BLL0_9EURO|nr:hypothetical protein EMPG_12955 [Blastomyces silverae]